MKDPLVWVDMVIIIAIPVVVGGIVGTIVGLLLRL